MQLSPGGTSSGGSVPPGVRQPEEGAAKTLKEPSDCGL